MICLYKNNKNNNNNDNNNDNFMILIIIIIIILIATIHPLSSLPRPGGGEPGSHGQQPFDLAGLDPGCPRARQTVKNSENSWVFAWFFCGFPEFGRDFHESEDLVNLVNYKV